MFCLFEKLKEIENSGIPKSLGRKISFRIECRVYPYHD